MPKGKAKTPVIDKRLSLVKTPISRGDELHFELPLGASMATRRDVVILHALFQELARIRYGHKKDWARVSNYQKVSSFFDGAAAVAAFANKLNQIEPMAGDSVRIAPGDIGAAKTVGNIYGTLLQAYKNAGWSIVA